MIHDSKETFFDDSITSPNIFYFGSGDEKAVLVTKTNINAINTEKNPCIEEHISTKQPASQFVRFISWARKPCLWDWKS